MTGAHRISAVIPTYNRAELALRAVESVLSQTRPADEVIVVDDGSTDGTAARLSRFGSRVRVVTKANGGAAAARNHGLREAAHPWVAFLDDDDLWRSRHLELIGAAIEATGGACGLYFGDVVDDDGRSWWELSGLRIAGDHETAKDPMAWAMLPRQPMAIPASVFHRDRTLAAGGFATLPIREDTNLYFALCLEGSVCAVAGAGAATTGDAGAARLTGVHSPASLVYCECSVRMYREVRARAARRGSPHVRALTGRLAMSHRHLATAQWRDGRRAAALASAARAFARAPFVTAGALLGRATSVSK